MQITIRKIVNVQLLLLLLIYAKCYYCLNDLDLTPQRCPGPADKGPCNRKIYKWAYEPKSQHCILFVWGGCAGNEKNRFDTEIQCMKRCSPYYNSE